MMRRASAIFGALGGAWAVLGAGACSDKATAPGAGRAAGPPSPVVLGAMAPLTGEQKDLGVQVQKVLRVAEGVLNAAGGVLGRPIKLDVRDDAGDVARTEQVGDAFLGADVGAVGVIGPSTSNGAQAIHERYREAQRVLITPLALSPVLSKLQPEGDRYLFRTEPSAALQARAAALFLTRRVPEGAGPTGGCKRIAILHNDDDSGTGNPVADEFKRALPNLGAAVAEQIKVSPNAKSYDGEVQRVVASNADCQAVLMLPVQGALYMRNFKERTATDRSRDWKLFTTLGSSAYSQRPWVANARQNPANDAELGAAEGVFGTALDPAPQTPEYGGFKNVYDTFYPPSSNPTVVPPPPAVYDAVMLLALAVQRAGSLTDLVAIRDSVVAVSNGAGVAGAKRVGPAAINDALTALKAGAEIDYQGASGSCDLDKRGDVIADHIIWRVDRGQFVTIARIKASEIAL